MAEGDPANSPHPRRRRASRAGLPAPPQEPLADPRAALAWLDWYLSPKSTGGAGHRAHQFTINGYTYPFVRYYNVAAVPDIPLDRRYDMYSGLELARPGDLLFFYESDPHPANVRGFSAADWRRGLRGLYRAVGHPYRTPGPLTDIVSGVGYTVLEKCPGCRTPHSKFGDSCPLCNRAYPPARGAGGGAPTARVLGTQLRIAPIWAFERAVSDERVYGDLAEPGLVWIGRHDNAMGPGKGSSIRHLLPEEARRVLGLLLTEPDQRVGPPGPHVPPRGAVLTHPGGQSVREVPLVGRTVGREDELYYILARQLLDPGSPMRRVLQPHLPRGVDWDDLEYISSTFPWGYTAGAADLVALFRSRGRRRFVLIFECKRLTDHDPAVLQAVLYVERTVQVLSAACPPEWLPPMDQQLEVLPVVVAAGLKRPRVGATLAVPDPYSFSHRYLGGNAVTAYVRTPLFLAYAPPAGAGAFGDADRFTFIGIPPNSFRNIAWQPPRGAVGTLAEKTWILASSWAAARRAAGI